MAENEAKLVERVSKPYAIRVALVKVASRHLAANRSTAEEPATEASTLFVAERDDRWQKWWVAFKICDRGDAPDDSQGAVKSAAVWHRIQVRADPKFSN
jgi:hypothetical protein